MSAAAMGKAKKPKGDADGEGYTTFRIYATDGDELGELARLLNVTVAEAYREVCAQIVRKKRIEKLEQKLKELKQ